jgi:hypothetical protein
MGSCVLPSIGPTSCWVARDSKLRDANPEIGVPGGDPSDLAVSNMPALSAVHGDEGTAVLTGEYAGSGAEYWWE